MSVFSKFMLRRGWIQLSRYGLEVSETGEVREMCKPPVLPAPSARVTAPMPQLNPALLDTVPQQSLANTGSELLDDDQAWEAAMARAKAQAEGEIAMADTDQIAAIEAPVADTDQIAAIAPAMATIAEVSQGEEGEEQDWEALIAAANQRAAEDGLPKLTDFVAPPILGAQVEQDATPANDDMPAGQVISIHHKRLSAPPAEARVPSPVDVDANWGTLQADAEAAARSEEARKERAMREIRRLQRTPASSGLGAPPRRRVAAGTKHGSVMPPIPTSAMRRPAPVAQDIAEIGESTLVEIPRITQRFS
tara:strand:- start:27573 stop:28493 length:921 start_codon:yes stop_codon:yes gene_type:complete